MDYSVVRYGFDIVRIEAKKGTQLLARYPGQWYEPETEVRPPTSNLVQHAGLHYNWHRYYDPNVGRYITPDPLGLEAGMNLYSYAGNDPVNNIDPFGLEEIQIHQWPIWGMRSERRNPHVGLLIKNKVLESMLFPNSSKDKKNIIFLDKSPIVSTRISSWFPPQSIYQAKFTTQPYAYKAYVWKFKTTFAQDLCVLGHGLASHQKCSQATAKNAYQGCRWTLLGGNNCEDWVVGAFRTCGIPIHTGLYQPLGSFGFTSNRTTYDWSEHLDENDKDFVGLRFLDFDKTRRRLWNFYYKNAILFVNYYLPKSFELSSP